MRASLPVLALSLVLAGCGGGGDEKGESDGAGPTTLSASQVKDAVISLDDLGSDFTLDDEDDDDDDDPDLGCLGDLGTVLDEEKDGSGKKFTKAAAKAEVEYKADSDAGMPFVFSSVYSLKKPDEIADAFAIFESAFADCTQVDTTDEDGARIQLDISVDTVAADGADSAVSMTAAGGFSIPGPQNLEIRLPFFLKMSMIQVDNNLTMIGYGSLVEEKEGLEDLDALTDLGIRRLQAVMDGNPVPEAPDLDLRLITEKDIEDAIRGATGSA